MVHRWLARTLIAAGLVAVGLHGASTAWAVGTSEVSITDGTLPVSATAFPTRVCPGAPRTDEDIWTFGALAGDPGTSAGFVQVTLTFDPGVGKVAEPSSTPAPTPTPGAVQIRTIGAESFLDPGVASASPPRPVGLLSPPSPSSPLRRASSRLPARVPPAVLRLWLSLFSPSLYRPLWYQRRLR
jgi:hypothetical protein